MENRELIIRCELLNEKIEFDMRELIGKFFKSFAVDDVKFSQYSGLKSKHQERIFDNNHVRYDNCLYVIYFEDGCFNAYDAATKEWCYSLYDIASECEIVPESEVELLAKELNINLD